jgi:hypothetical protein
MAILSPSQIDFYHTQGYLVLKSNEYNLAVPKQLQDCTNEVSKWPCVKGKWMPYNEITASGEEQLMRTEILRITMKILATFFSVKGLRIF